MEKKKPEAWHRTHCCRDHGCDYGDPACPVVALLIRQSYPCRKCPDTYEDKSLLPCPFCRGEAVLHFWNEQGGWKVKCTWWNCQAIVTAGATDTKGAAIEKWNTRAGVPKGA